MLWAHCNWNLVGWSTAGTLAATLPLQTVPALEGSKDKIR